MASVILLAFTFLFISYIIYFLYTYINQLMLELNHMSHSKLYSYYISSERDVITTDSLHKPFDNFYPNYPVTQLP